MTVFTRSAAALLAAGMGASLLAGQPAGAAPSVPGDTDVGTSFTDRLIPGQYLSNGGYRFVMQRDGNLVLYSGARPCWASGTNGTDGVYAQYSGDWKIDSPYLTLESPYGELRKYRGGYTYTRKTGNVSLNDRGEVYIAYEKLAGC